MALKEVLGIRTFDQIQAELSKRLNQQLDFEVKTEAIGANHRSNCTTALNPQESSFREPLNLLGEFRRNIDDLYSGQSHTIDDKT